MLRSCDPFCSKVETCPNLAIDWFNPGEARVQCGQEPGHFGEKTCKVFPDRRGSKWVHAAKS